MTRGLPAGLLASLEDVSFVCPLCRGNLDSAESGYRCPACRRLYPLHAGIPDFRVFPDPYLDFEADRERADRVLEIPADLPFREVLERYWSWSAETPAALRTRFVESALAGEVRARRLLSVASEQGLPNEEEGAVLDIGSGTGNLLAAAGGRFRKSVGVDIAMRWLHLSRRRFSDRDLPEPALVCACAEALPFPAGAFKAAFSLGTVEFARSPGRLFAEASRVLEVGAGFFLNTVNRFSIAPEPHVDLVGVGFLPRRWQATYVRRRRHASFEHIRLLSRRELDRLAAPFFSSRSFLPPRFSDETLARLPPSRRRGARIYLAACRIPAARVLLGRIGPEWDLILRANERGGAA